MNEHLIYHQRIPELAVVLATPHTFADISLTVAHLLLQTKRDKIELVLVGESLNKLAIPEGAVNGFAVVRFVRGTQEVTLGEARARGARQAEAPLIAFAEDHAFPEPEWADALINAHQASWSAVGPVVINANPRTAVSKADFFIGYGPWRTTGNNEGREVDLLPGHNSCYKREALQRYDSELGTLLQAETVLFWRLREDGFKLWLEPKARLHHTNFSLWKPWLQVQFHHGRLFGGTRATSWSRGKRAFYTAASPLIPLVRFARLLRMLNGSASTSTLATIFIGLIIDGCGQMAGYSRGSDSLEQNLWDWKMEFQRTRFTTRRDRRIIRELEMEVCNRARYASHPHDTQL